MEKQIVIELRRVNSTETLTLKNNKISGEFSVYFNGGSIGMFPEQWGELVEFTQNPKNTVLQLATLTISMFKLGNQWRCVLKNYGELEIYCIVIRITSSTVEIII